MPGPVDIARRTRREMDLDGVTVVEAIPTMGVPAAIAGTHLISTLGLEHVVGFHSDAFPPVSLVWNGKPRSPLRVYASSEHAIAVVACEFTPDPELYRPIGRAILSWAQDAGAARVLCPDGVAPFDDDYDPKSPRIVGAATTPRLRAEIEKANIPLLDRGMLSGVSAMMLADADESFDVGVLGVEVSVEAADRIHDARGAAVLIDALSRLHPQHGIQGEPLHKQAEKAEILFRDLREKAARAQRRDESSFAYR